jgi:PAS domain S-box-containing protein
LVESVKPTSSLEGDPPVAATPRAAADHARLAEIALERTRMPIVITDPRQPDNPIVLANQAFLDLSGYNAEEVLGRNCRFLQGAGTSPVAIDAIRAGVAAEQDFHVEILNYRKDGTAFWNQLNVSPVHDEAGQLLYFFASQIDVTDFRKVQTLEASEHRLLKEVDHRARNVMAVVNGIVRLTRADDSRRYAEAIQLRVKALADAHTLLAERGWKEVSLGDVVAQQITAVDATRITALGPDVSVSAFVFSRWRSFCTSCSATPWPTAPSRSLRGRCRSPGMTYPRQVASRSTGAKPAAPRPDVTARPGSARPC